MPATNYLIRIISDSKDPFKVNSYSAWVSKKPFVFYTKTLKRREEVELVIKVHLVVFTVKYQYSLTLKQVSEFDKNKHLIRILLKNNKISIISLIVF